MVGLYNLLMWNCWNSRWVVETNPTVGLSPLELALWTSRPKSKSSRSPWVEWGCGGYEKSWSFVQVGEIFEKTGCCQLPFEWLVDCKCSITGQFEPLNPSFVKTPSMFFLLYFYLDTSCSQLIWQILFQMVWKLKLPSIFHFSKHNLPRRVMNCFGPSLPVSGFNSILSRLGWRCTGGRWLLLKIRWRDFMVGNCPKSSTSKFETHPILESAFIAGHEMTTAAAAPTPHYYFTTDWLDTNLLIGYSHSDTY